MKKKIAVLLITIILVMNFFSTIILAETQDATAQEQQALQESDGDVIIEGSNPDNFKTAWEKGTVTTFGEEENKNAIIDPGGKSNYTPLRVIARVLLLIPQFANEILSLITTTINSIDRIAQNISVWFVGIRNLSTVIIAIILVYIGIRLTLATIAEEKAQYKKMLMGWLEGIVLLFVLHYLIIIFIYISDWIVNWLSDLMKDNQTTMQLEENMLQKISDNLFKTSSKWGWVLYGTLYTLLTLSEIQIFVFYISRLLKIAYLIIISPLVCVTYSIDKIKDGKAQAFENWIKEFAISVLAQPLQLFIYVLLIDSTGEIISKNMGFGVIFLLLLPYGVRIFKSVLKFGENSKDFENAGKFKDSFLK